MPLFNFNKRDVRAEYHQGGDVTQMLLKVNRGIQVATERNIADLDITGAGAGRDFVAQILYTDQNAGQLKQPIVPRVAALVTGARDSTEQGLNLQIARLIAKLVATPNAGDIHKIVVGGSSDAQTYMALILFQEIQQAEPDPE